MTLLQPIASISLHYERLQSMAMLHLPRIGLAAGPMLLPGTVQALQANPPVQGPSVAGRAARAAGSQAAGARGFVPHSLAGRASTFPLGDPLPAGRGMGIVFETQRWLAVAPLQQALARGDPPEDADRTSPMPSASVRGCLQILRRITDERQRVEERVQRILVLRQPPIPVVNAAAADAVVARLPRSSRAGASEMTPRGASSSVDIEQLTERVVRNIDRQIVAYRERMGRVF